MDRRERVGAMRAKKGKLTCRVTICLISQCKGGWFSEWIYLLNSKLKFELLPIRCDKEGSLKLLAKGPAAVVRLIVELDPLVLTDWQFSRSDLISVPEKVNAPATSLAVQLDRFFLGTTDDYIFYSK